jgi:hypothetical protein
VENNKVLNPEKEHGLIAYTHPQSMSDETAELRVEQQPGGNVDGSIAMDEKNRTLRDTAFVWRREDGTNAVVQTWPTSLNAKFHQDFEISKGVNRDPAKFVPQAVSEFKQAMVELFGSAATSCPIWFCSKKLASTSPAVVGLCEEVLAHLKEHPELMRELAIASIDSDGLGFVSDGRTGKGQTFVKPFRLKPGEQYVVYRKTGWETMGCSKPLDQFLHEANFHELVENTAAATTAEVANAPPVAANADGPGRPSDAAAAAAAVPASAGSDGQALNGQTASFSIDQDDGREETAPDEDPVYRRKSTLEMRYEALDNFQDANSVPVVELPEQFLVSQGEPSNLENSARSVEFAYEALDPHAKKADGTSQSRDEKASEALMRAAAAPEAQ